MKRNTEHLVHDPCAPDLEDKPVVQFINAAKEIDADKYDLPACYDPPFRIKEYICCHHKCKLVFPGLPTILIQQAGRDLDNDDDNAYPFFGWKKKKRCKGDQYSNKENGMYD